MHSFQLDPLIPLGIDMVGAAIHTRLAAEGKPGGAVVRSAAPYSTGFNGGIRTTAYFTDQIGILTQTIGNPTPMEIPLVLDIRHCRGDVQPNGAADLALVAIHRVLVDERLRGARHGVEAKESSC